MWPVLSLLKENKLSQTLRETIKISGNSIWVKTTTHKDHNRTSWKQVLRTHDSPSMSIMV